MLNTPSESNGNSPRDPVSINVGGEVYTTTLDTLTRCRDSMLGAMFTGQIPLLRDRRGNYFIDRDGKVFRYILNYLRSNTLDLPEGFKELALLKREADFFQIRPLLDEIRRHETGSGTAVSCRAAMLNVTIESAMRVLHFNLKRAPENYELRSCAVRMYVATVFCTSRAVVELMCVRFSYSSRDGPVAPQPNNTRQNCLRLEWVPCPDELPRDQHEKQGFRELKTECGAGLRDAPAFMEELLRVALCEGFRVDSVFPDPSDILNCSVLRFVRY